MGNVDVNGIKTMEEAIAAIGYVQRKFENEWELVEQYMKRNEDLLSANITLRKNLQKTMRSNHHWKVAFCTGILGMGLIGYYATKKWEKELDENIELRARLDELEAKCEDDFFETESTED